MPLSRSDRRTGRAAESFESLSEQMSNGGLSVSEIGRVAPHRQSECRMRRRMRLLVTLGHSRRKRSHPDCGRKFREVKDRTVLDDVDAGISCERCTSRQSALSSQERGYGVRTPCKRDNGADMDSEVKTRASRTGRARAFPLSRKLIVLGNVLKRGAGARYRRLLGLTGGDWGVIAQLGERAPRTLNDLADSMGLDKTQISRAVSGLVERGFVKREVNPSNQREILITLTKSGMAAEAVIHEAGAHVNRTLLQGLTRAQRDTLEQQIDAFMKLAETLLRNEQDPAPEPDRQA